MFLVFTGDEYYPLGGWEDYKGQEPSLDEARSMAEKVGGDWYQIVDDRRGWIVEQGGLENITTYDPYEEKCKAVPTKP